LAILAAASLGGMAVTSTLAVTAIQARDEARDQRRQAEGLIEFMVGDLRDKLEPIGKLSVLDGVGSRVLAYYSKQNTSELSDDALVQRSKALNLMAEVAYDRGNLDEAEKLYRQAVAGTAEAVRRTPNDADRLYEHAQNVFWVGEVARSAGRPKESEAAYREYKRIADQMASLQPDNLKYRMEVLYANEDLGISLFDQHRFVEASQQFDGTAKQMENLIALYPSNMAYQNEFANALGWVADAQRAQGNLDSAIAVRNRLNAFLNELADKSADSFVREKLVWAHQGLGLLLSEKGQSDRGLQELHAAVDEAEDLIQVEPRNAGWKSNAAAAHFYLATTLLSLARNDEAAQQTDRGCALTGALPTTFAISARSKMQTTCAMLRSRLALGRGDSRLAAKFAQDALASARSGHSQDPTEDRHVVALTYLILGDVRRQAKDPEGASTAWNAGLSEIPTNVAERPWEMSTRAQLLKRLGRPAEAAPMDAHLAAIGYKPVI
jgi:tetratricopeptide (TPR) repeat protein